jgi:hypothetical protein
VGEVGSSFPCAVTGCSGQRVSGSLLIDYSGSKIISACVSRHLPNLDRPFLASLSVIILAGAMTITEVGNFREICRLAPILTQII